MSLRHTDLVIEYSVIINSLFDFLIYLIFVLPRSCGTRYVQIPGQSSRLGTFHCEKRVMECLKVFRYTWHTPLTTTLPLTSIVLVTLAHIAHTIARLRQTCSPSGVALQKLKRCWIGSYLRNVSYNIDFQSECDLLYMLSCLTTCIVFL